MFRRLMYNCDLFNNCLLDSYWTPELLNMEETQCNRYAIKVIYLVRIFIKPLYLEEPTPKTPH